MIIRHIVVLIFCTFLFSIKTNAQIKLGKKEIKNLLEGAWFGSEDDDAAVFSIDGDTIMYIDDFSKFKYKVTKDTFEIQTIQLHYKEIIVKLNADSLIFKEVPSGEISKYWKGN